MSAGLPAPAGRGARWAGSLVRTLERLVRGCLRFCWWLTALLVSWSRRLFDPRWWARRFHWTRSLSLRRWLIVALIALVFVPGLIAGLTGAVIALTGNHSDDAASRLLKDGIGLWSDPDWQRAAAGQFDAAGIDVVLFENGVEVFRTSGGPDAGRGPDEIRQYNFSTPGVERMALVYGAPWEFGGNDGNIWLVPIAYLVALFMTFVGIAWFIGRTVVRPLAATSHAAGEVAGGNLEIVLPGSRVREVAQVNEAFVGMSHELDASLKHEATLEGERRLFISAIAHDLRTPLFSLRGSLEAIETGIASTPERQAHYLGIAREKADALERLTADLFAYARLEYLDQSPKREWFDMKGLLEQLINGLQPQAEAKGIALELVTGTGAFGVEADPHMLTRAIENLIDNAIRYSPEGGSVQVELLQDGEGTVVSVIDSGPGIPPDDLAYLFDPLYRGEDSRNRLTGGAGLGLTIAQNIFFAHGGDLTARNMVPHGAVSSPGRYRVASPRSEVRSPGVSGSGGPKPQYLFLKSSRASLVRIHPVIPDRDTTPVTT